MDELEKIKLSNRLSSLLEHKKIRKKRFLKKEMKTLERYMSQNGSIKEVVTNGVTYLKVLKQNNIKALIEELRCKNTTVRDCLLPEQVQQPQGITKRAKNIFNNGSSKDGDSRIENHPILLKSFTDIYAYNNGHAENLKTKTDAMGLTAYAMCSNVELKTFNGKDSLRIAFVENLESFMHIEHIISKYNINIDIAIWHHGNLSKTLLEEVCFWNNDCIKVESITMFVDYDPVGIDSYIRAHDYFSNTSVKVKMFTPLNDIEAIMNIDNIKGKHLLNDQKFSEKIGRFSEFSNNNNDANLYNLLIMMKRYGKGVEQESLFT